MDMFEFVILPAGILIITIIAAIAVGRMKYDVKRIITPMNTLFAGVFLAGFAVFHPLMKAQFGLGVNRINVFLGTVFYTIKIFVLEGDLQLVQDFVKYKTGLAPFLYQVISLVILTGAPLLTFGFILSFFKNFMAYVGYACSFFKSAYIFSELNDRSVALAESIRLNHKNVSVVFTDVFEKNDETTYDLLEKARELKAICFKKDILSLKLDFHTKSNKGKKMNFFVIGSDEGENIKQGMELIKHYGHRSNSRMFVFASCKEGELLFSNAEQGTGMTLRRVNHVRSLTYDLLYGNNLERGIEIFNRAVKGDDGCSEISAVIVGMGEHGFEMTKALTWLCQMDNYKIRINVFDRDADAEDKFTARCPELMDAAHNRKDNPEDARYDITIHSGVDVKTAEFLKRLRGAGNITYVFVSLGDDSLNTETAVRLREELLNMGCRPVIHAVVYDSDKNRSLKGITTFDGAHEFDIDFIGDLKTVFSEESIINPDLEKEALSRHKIHDKSENAEENFYRYEYNYRSSVASTIHIAMRKRLGIAGALKRIEERTEEEKRALRLLEHKRWNAYMRTEGYRYGEKNHLTKTHCDLVPFCELPKEKQRWDDA